ncbi:DNA replication regulator SLD3 [Metschnikowia aff. pulcherrima]|uniref:DNA replication regulator SLD3 n=1 Tax=Metschnikowia aff. pulcherrima TaxID=2163413 RepID=A0A4P6XR50_9ASCO|nr:DNA replication regulator SLD3 [Metschnikowia aff. pulcherrima]
MATHSPSSVESSLPACLTISNGSDPSHNIVITVTKQLPYIYIESLNPELFSSRKSVWLSQVSRTKLGAENGTFLVKVQTLNSEALRHGILTSCGFEGAYELLEGSTEPLNSDVFTETGMSVFENNCFPDSKLPVGDYIEAWSEAGEELVSSDIDRNSFSMRPPLIPSLGHTGPVALKYTISPQNEKNPLDFLLSRYFNTLYSLTTPLSYFPKTALSRFKNMCSGDSQQVIENLSKVYLSQDQLDRRRTAKFGLPKQALDAGQVFFTRFEQENQALFASKHHDELSKEDLMENLVLELKVREAQLQILLLLEILVCSQVDEDAFLDTSQKQHERPKKSKPSLIRRKKTKVVPTFLGVGVPDANDEPKLAITSQNHISHASLFLSLSTLIDQIGLWDSLLDRAKLEKDQNTHGFLAFVVVPYFSKSLPKVVHHVIKGFKDLRPNIMKSKSTNAERRIAKELFSVPLEADVAAKELGPATPPLGLDFTKSLSSLDMGHSEKPAERKSKFSKTLLSKDEIPHLSRAATTIDIDNAAPAFSLKRSKSNLGAKNLKRRQVDMSVAKSETTVIEPSKQNLFLFADARKIKLAANLGLTNATSMAIREVEATPAKPKARSSKGNKPQVFATPSNQRTADMDFIVKETPHTITSAKKPSVHERISQVADSGNNMAIDSSPVKDLEEALFLRSLTYDDTSPVKMVNSLPFVKTKPGQQIPIRQSPFYTGQLAGSPPLLKSTPSRILPLAERDEAKKQTVKKPTSKTAARKSVAKKVTISARKERRVAQKPVLKKKPAPKEKPASKEKPVAANHLISGLSNADIFEIGPSEPSAPENESFADSVRGPPVDSKIPAESVSASSQGSKISGTTTHSFLDAPDTDSDSDYERLLAAVLKPAPKKYTKKRT